MISCWRMLIVLFQGNEVSVIVKQSERRYITLSDNCILVLAPDPLQAHKILHRWLKERCSLIIRQSVWRISRQMHLDVTAIQIRDQRTRWGSCSSKGVLSFNFRIALAPKEVMDYVVVHELAHLVERNHSERFWSIVERYCSDYRQHRSWLRRNEKALVVPELK